MTRKLNTIVILLAVLAALADNVENNTKDNNGKSSHDTNRHADNDLLVFHLFIFSKWN